MLCQLKYTLQCNAAEPVLFKTATDLNSKSGLAPVESSNLDEKDAKVMNLSTSVQQRRALCDSRDVYLKHSPTQSRQYLRIPYFSI